MIGVLLVQVDILYYSSDMSLPDAISLEMFTKWVMSCICHQKQVPALPVLQEDQAEWENNDDDNSNDEAPPNRLSDQTHSDCDHSDGSNESFASRLSRHQSSYV